MKFSPVILATFILISLFQSCHNQSDQIAAPLLLEDRERLNLIPLPVATSLSDKTLDLSKGLYIVPVHYKGTKFSKGVEQFIFNMKAIDVSTSDPGGINLNLETSDELDQKITDTVDESYNITIDDSGIHIVAPNYTGINHGLTTLTQIVYSSRDEVKITRQSIKDSPRFGWRGLMIDVSRNWISKETLLENIRGMSLVKMNILHLHLSDDQSFRMESKVFPELHMHNFDRKYYTQKDMIEIVQYANDLGIRVIPEFDMPGHTTSWLIGYPKLSSGPPPTVPETALGIFPNVLNPVNDTTYLFIETLLIEMSSIFIDDYIHIGGNEILPEYWNTDEHVTQFMIENNLENIQQVHSYFILRVQQIVRKLGKKLIAWDEALRKQIADGNTIIQAWRDQHYAFAAARLNIHSILSKGWYLDYKLPISALYSIDPYIDPDFKAFAPDSSHWQTWEINVQFRENISQGYLHIFGKNQNLSGVIQLNNQTLITKDISYLNDRINFNFDMGSGRLQAQLKLEEQKLNGDFGVAIFDIPVTGRLLGGNGFEGVEFPEIPQRIPLTKVEEQMILGGEACMWGEWVNDENISSRIWPATTAVAEKLWSPSKYTDDYKDFYRRLSTIKELLISSGINYISNQTTFIRRIAKEVSPVHLQDFIESLEEVKFNDRWTFNPDHSVTDSLNSLCDVVSPESFVSFRFGILVDQLLTEGTSPELTQSINNQLDQWIPIYRSIESIFSKEPSIRSVEVLALALSDLSKIAAHVMESKSLTSEELQYYHTLKENAQRKIDGVLLAPTSHLTRLIDSHLTSL